MADPMPLFQPDRLNKILSEQIARERSGPADLQPDVPGVTSMDMASDVTDAKIAASEARTDAKFERVLSEMRVGFSEVHGDIRELGAKISTLPSRWTVLSAAFGAAIAAVGLVLAALSFGNDMFSKGFTTHDVARQAAQEALAAYRTGSVPQK